MKKKPKGFYMKGKGADRKVVPITAPSGLTPKSKTVHPSRDGAYQRHVMKRKTHYRLYAGDNAYIYSYPTLADAEARMKSVRKHTPTTRRMFIVKVEPDGTFQTVKNEGEKAATIPAHAVRELDLWQANTYELYRRRQAWAKNYGRKMQKGKYNRKLALKGIRDNFVPEVVKNYRQSQGDYIHIYTHKDDPEDYYLGRMSKADKQKVAERILSDVEEDAKYMVEHEPEKLKIRRS